MLARNMTNCEKYEGTGGKKKNVILDFFTSLKIFVFRISFREVQLHTNDAHFKYLIIDIK